jgi:hypothetical protein
VGKLVKRKQIRELQSPKEIAAMLSHPLRSGILRCLVCFALSAASPIARAFPVPPPPPTADLLRYETHLTVAYSGYFPSLDSVSGTAASLGTPPGGLGVSATSSDGRTGAFSANAAASASGTHLQNSMDMVGSNLDVLGFGPPQGNGVSAALISELTDALTVTGASGIANIHWRLTGAIATQGQFYSPATAPNADDFAFVVLDGTSLRDFPPSSFETTSGGTYEGAFQFQFESGIPHTVQMELRTSINLEGPQNATASIGFGLDVLDLTLTDAQGNALQNVQNITATNNSGIPLVFQTVPEPSVVTLLTAGAVIALLFGRRRASEKGSRDTVR